MLLSLFCFMGGVFRGMFVFIVVVHMISNQCGMYNFTGYAYLDLSVTANVRQESLAVIGTHKYFASLRIAPGKFKSINSI